MRPIKQKQMIILIGSPGAGKTELLATKTFDGYLRFDNDRIIEAIWGSLQFHMNIKRMARGMVREGIRRAMDNGLALVVPISGRTVADRNKMVSLAREVGYSVKIVLVKATPEECLIRCKNDPARPKSTDWKPIIDRWFKIFEPVQSDECDEYEEMGA